MNTIYQAENNYLNQMEKPEIPDLWYLIFGIILIVFSSFKVEAQDLSFNNLVPASVTVCEGSETFTIEFSNISTETLSNVEAVISLPTGMNYLSSSLSETSNFNVQEANVSNDAALTFSIDDLPPAATVNFTLQADAGFAAYTAQLAGTIFANQITINYNGDSQSETMDAYNILYPALSITQVSSMTNTVFVGQAFTRTITIVNGGYGSLSSFVLKDILDENLSFTAVDLGNLNTNTGEVTFSAADFVGVGNGDGMLDQNEALVVTQTLTAAACNSAQDQLIAYWGCDGQTTGSNIKYPYTTIKLFAPNLSISAQPSLATCFDESADAQQLTITNNGSGPANLLEMEILPNQQDEYTRVDPASIKYELNGVTTSLTPTATQNATGYDCLGANPIDGFTVDLPTIQPGETVYLRWDNYTCTTAYCGNVHFVGWKYESSYTDMCDKNQYSKSGNGQSNQEKNMGTFHESPSDILDGQLATYVMNINTATFKLPEGNGAYFEAVFKVPLGLTWSGNAVDLRYESGTDSWTADQVNYNSTTREIKAKYSLPIPTNFSLTHSHFDLDLTADCSNGGGMVTLGMQLFYVMDASCTDAYHIPMTCLETPQTQIHCPGNCSEGLGFSSFSIERTSFGQSDNDLDGLPDATNQLDF